MKQNTIKTIEDTGIVGVLRGIIRDDALRIGEALLAGGVNCMEVTYKPDGDWSETAKTIEALCTHFGDEMKVGAGTVMFEKQIEMTAQAGGLYVISPNVNRDIIKKTCEMGLVSIPGAFTPTECQDAHEAGADFVKLFPMTGMGPIYVQMLTGPLPHIKFLVVGGVTEDNFADFIRAGAIGMGGGLPFGFGEAIKTRDFSIITKKVKVYKQILDQTRG